MFQIRVELAEELRNMLISEPEFANCRSCGVLSQYAVDGSTPLHCAAKWGNLEVVKMLLSLKKSTESQERLVDVWARDLQGRVPLHLAAENEHEAICRVLMNAMTEEEPSIAPSPSPLRSKPRSVVGVAAPVDLTGTTPLGWASRKAKGRPNSPIRELLFSQGDHSILPQRNYSERSGKTPCRSSKKSQLNPDLNRMIFAHSDAQGWRPEMEDRVLTCCPLSLSASTEGLDSYCLFGVFDGHGGDFTSNFVSKKLPSVLTTQLDLLSHPIASELSNALYKSCLIVDELLSEEERMKVTAKSGNNGKISVSVNDGSGSTGCICLLSPNDIICANIGDSRAILARQQSSSLHELEMQLEFLPLSRDQKFNDIEERDRAINAGYS